MKGQYNSDDAVFTHKGEPIDPVDGSIVYEKVPMTTVQVPTSELVGEALDWASAKAYEKANWQVVKNPVNVRYLNSDEARSVVIDKIRSELGETVNIPKELAQ